MFNSHQKNDQQAEFFKDLAKQSKKQSKSKFKLSRIAISLSYENMLIFAIGLIMLLIVSYSLGVERGKLLVKISSEDILMGEEKQQQAPEEEPPASLPKPRKKRVKIKVAALKETPKVSPYIQVASFLTEKNADKEVARLKDKGYQSFATTWGRYKVVCVGGYADKAEATKAFRQLRKLYADCILHNE